jgi:PhnB protein
MNVYPYVQFGGRCAEAFAYYEAHLGGTGVQTMPYRGSPAEEMAPPEWRDKVMHGSIKIGDATLMGTDAQPQASASGMQGCALTLAVDTLEQAERMFAALAQDGTVKMALAPSFFAARFGIVTDQFGVAWMVICEKPS